MGNNMIENLVLGCLGRIRDKRKSANKFEVNLDLVVVGNISPLDSLDVINLIVDLEERFLLDCAKEMSLSDYLIDSMENQGDLKASDIVLILNNLLTN
jgi:acyl carrier protein